MACENMAIESSLVMHSGVGHMPLDNHYHIAILLTSHTRQGIADRLPFTLDGRIGHRQISHFSLSPLDKVQL